ncbi:hypothetical protein GCM10009807_24220 [Microbacterium lacus]|uniref:DUF3068 domain-containing protein n=1 Tax=Microbacterium lacus TaxID=415217 RepID=A0ABN2GZR2_9MICO
MVAPRAAARSGVREMAGWARVLVAAILVTSLGAGVWGGLLAIAQPSLETLDQKDSIELWTDRREAELSIVWTLSADGQVSLRVTHVGDGQDRAPAIAYVVFSCGARLENVVPSLDFQQDSPPAYELITAGDPSGCQALDEPIGFHELEYQLLTAHLRPGESLLLTGKPIEAWSSETLNARLARSPQMASISVGADEGDGTPFSYYNYPLLKTVEATIPARSSFAVALQATATEERQAVYGPEGTGVEQQTSNSVIDWGNGRFVDSIQWSAQNVQVLYSGIARWSEPGGLNRSQLLLLIAGALLGVAASIGVEILLRLAERRERLVTEAEPGADRALKPPIRSAGRYRSRPHHRRGRLLAQRTRRLP